MVIQFAGVAINVLDQASIDTAKRQYPGAGVGPAVSAKLTEMLAQKSVLPRDLPDNYRHIGLMFQ